MSFDISRLPGLYEPDTGRLETAKARQVAVRPTGLVRCQPVGSGSHTLHRYGPDGSTAPGAGSFGCSVVAMMAPWVSRWPGWRELGWVRQEAVRSCGRGRSGAVTTAATSCFDDRIFRRHLDAKSGVPKKISLIQPFRRL